MARTLRARPGWLHCRSSGGPDARAPILYLGLTIGALSRPSAAYFRRNSRVTEVAFPAVTSTSADALKTPLKSPASGKTAFQRVLSSLRGSAGTGSAPLGGWLLSGAPR